MQVKGGQDATAQAQAAAQAIGTATATALAATSASTNVQGLLPCFSREAQRSETV